MSILKQFCQKLNNVFNLNQATEIKFRLEFLQRKFKTSLKVLNKTPKVYLKSPFQKDIQGYQDVLEKESSHTRKNLKSKQFKQDPIGMMHQTSFQLIQKKKSQEKTTQSLVISQG